MTEAKRKMIDAGRSDLDSWCKNVMAEPDGVLALGGGGRVVPDLWNLGDLAKIYKQTHEDRGVSSYKALGKSLEAAGAFKTDRVRTKLGRICLYAVRNGDSFKVKTLDEIGVAYDQNIQMTPELKYAG
jgi:hypothetical protein